MDISIRELAEPDLPAARSVMNLAFGTFIGVPKPEEFAADRDYVSTRWKAPNTEAFAAERDGEIVGSNIVTNWGSVGFFGPLTVRPDLWDTGVGKLLMEPTMECFERWGTRHAGLFTFSHSAKHVGLYSKFGFWPRFLTTVMSKPVQDFNSPSAWSTFSSLDATGKEARVNECRKLAGNICPGMDLTGEIRAVDDHQLGDTVLLADGGFAICHCGAGTEAGEGNVFVKFGAAGSAEAFGSLLVACEAFAASREASRLHAGVNLARENAARLMRKRGFRTEIQGVTMHRPNEPGYSRPDAYVMDDWR